MFGAGVVCTKFELDAEQEKRLQSWRKNHFETAHPKGVRDMTGAALRFTFIPSGIGDNVTVECIWCPNVKVTLTIGDDGEFLYNEDGTKNGW